MPVELNPKLLAIEKQSNRKRKIVAWLTVLSIILCIFLIYPKNAHADDTTTPPADTQTDDSQTDNNNQNNGQTNGQGTQTNQNSTMSEQEAFIKMQTAMMDFQNAQGMEDEASYFFNPKYCCDTYTDLIIDLQHGNFVKTSVDDFYSTGVVEQIIDDITGQTQSWMSSLTAALKAIATLLVIYHMIVAMLKELQRGEMTMEAWLRILIAFIIPAVAIAELDFFLTAFSKIGQWIYGILSEAIVFTPGQEPHVEGIKWIPWSDDYWGIFEFNKFLGYAIDYAFAWIKTMFIVLAYLIVDCIIIVMIFASLIGTYVELILRHLFMPIAIANISAEGPRSIGIRYIKKYLGCYMRIGAIMVAVCAIFYVYMLLLNATSTTFEAVIYFLILVPGTKKAIQMCNEIISDALGD